MIKNFSITLLLFFVLLTLSCKKERYIENNPSEPTTLTATITGPTQVNLTWKDNSTNETGFIIERKISSGSFQEIARVGANVTNFTDQNLTSNTTYIYRILAYNKAGNSLRYSNEASITTIPDLLTNLLAYYPFNGNANDESGNANNVTISGATLTTDRTGNTNKALSFSGITTGAYLSNTTIKPQVFSISAWCKVVNTWSYSTFNILEIGPNDNTTPGGFSLRIDQNDIYGAGLYRIYANINNVFPQSSSQNFAFMNRWNHYLITRDLENIKLYINGELNMIERVTGTIDYTNATLQIGNKQNINNNQLGSRLIDDIRIYGRVLTNDQIVYLSKN